MSDKSGFASSFLTVSRRDAIRLIAATPASSAVVATSLPTLALAEPAISTSGAVTQLPYGSGMAPRRLANLAAEHFEPLVGERFTIAGNEATLSEVRRGPASGARFREQFALTFSAPQHRLMLSDISPVSHPAIGRHDLHVAQVGGAVFEICFS
ncbi:MAG: hypothetical protein WAV27_13075 [Xanthobacteraceae bacterium]